MKFNPPLFHPNSRLIRFYEEDDNADSLVVQSTPLGTCASRSCTRLAMIRMDMNRLANDGVRCSRFKEFCSLCFRFSPVRPLDPESMSMLMLRYLAEPNVESGANIDACVSSFLPRCPKSNPSSRCRKYSETIEQSTIESFEHS